MDLQKMYKDWAYRMVGQPTPIGFAEYILSHMRCERCKALDYCEIRKAIRVGGMFADIGSFGCIHFEEKE